MTTRVEPETIRFEPEKLEAVVKSLELQKQREELQIIFDSMPAMIFQLNREHRLVHVNRAYVEAVGLPKEWLEGKSTREIFPDQADRYWKDDEEVMTSGRPKRNIVEPFETPTGTRWAQTEKIPCRDATGNIIGVLAFALDITERKRMEEELRQLSDELKSQRAELQTILDSVPALIFYKDKENRLLRVNKAYADAIGKPRENIEGRSDVEFHPQEEAERHWRDDEEVIESGSPKIHIIQPIETSKGTRWLEANKIPYRDEKGNVVGIIGFSIDITERKRLEDVNARLAAIVESSNDGIISKTLDGTITSCNKAYEKIYGYTAKELIGKSLEFSVPPGYVDEAKRVRERVRRGELVQHYESKRIRKDGKIIDVSLTVSPIKDDAGRIVGISGIVRDITERKRIEQNLEESEKRLSAILDSVHAGIMVIDVETHKIVDANSAAAKMIELPRERIVGQICHKFICHAEQGKCPIADLDQQVDNSERVLLNASGHRIPVLKSVTSLVLGGRRQLIESFLNITELKRAEKEIASLARFPDEDPLPVMRVRNDGLVLYANQASQPLLQNWHCSVGDLATTPLSDLVADAYVSQPTSEVEVEVGERTHLFTLAPVRDEGYVNLYGRDITDRKRLEEELKKYSQQLEEIVKQRTGELTRSEAKFRNIYNTSLSGIYMTSINGDILDMSPAGVTMLGYDSLEELKKVNFQAIYADSRDRERFIKLAEAGPVKNYEKQLKRKDGKIIDTIESSYAIRNQDGRIIGYQGMIVDHSERKLMEKKLQESDERYRQLVENTDTGFVVIDDKGFVVEANEPYLRLVGREKMNEVVAHSVIEWTAPGEKEQNAEAVALCARQGYIQDFETIYQHRDGTRVNVMINATVQETSHGKHLVAFLRNITERKQMEYRVHQLVEELTALDATVLGITAATDLPSVLRTIVERAVELLRTDAGALYICNLEQQEVRGVISYKMPIDAAGIVLKYGEGSAGTVAKTGQPLIIDDCRTWLGRATAYEHIKQFRALLSVPLIWHGTVTGVINMVSYNESRRFTQDDLTLLTRFAKHAAIVVERRKLEDRLRESEEQFRRIAEGSFDPILTFNQQLQVTFASPALFLMTGYAPEQVIGKHFTSFLPEEESAKRMQAFSRVLAGEVVRAQETELLMADGSLAPVEITLSPITESDGTVIGVESILRDTSERHRLAELKDRFMSSVTHELRTPLVSINGYLDLMLSDGQVSGEVESYLQVVKRNSDRLLALTNDLLDVQRMQAGKLQLNMQPLNLHEVIEQSIKEIKPLLEERKQKLTVKVPEDSLLVMGDPVRLSQVFMNLLSNANKFAPETGEITLSTNETRGIVQIQVSNNGIGIKREDLERIFQPFASIQKPGYIKGTGLGLSITKGLVEAHGGKIWAESEGEGQGATFTFTIPKQKA